jgi:demethylmenaquinone methyltransferase / 2-methoxy-6-polyprenyl-1,4-benzoquinol methylase
MAKPTPPENRKIANPSVAFGYRAVAPGDKQKLVNQVFSQVAERYDQMNDLLSGGLHRLWKDDLVSLLNPPRNARAFRVLDVAGGTGDVAFRIARAGGSGTEVVVADISPAMIAEGRKRARQEQPCRSLPLRGANAEALPFPDRSFEAYTVAFGIRNVTHIGLRWPKPIGC